MTEKRTIFCGDAQGSWERSVVRCGRVHICVCVHAHISEVMGFCPVTVAAEHFPIIPCSQPCCSLHRSLLWRKCLLASVAMRIARRAE
uniref:Uncharacterized protein n=1 Tax=Mola mola TaxID=94237 RepID=A0A3Q3VYI2_MOLML